MLAPNKHPNKYCERGGRVGHDFDDELRGKVSANLSGFESKSIDDGGLKQAAVAIIVAPISQGNFGSSASILMTKRVAKMNRHAGQWALPGGRIDAGETPLEAAIRETDEEIGLDINAGALMGQLDDCITRSGYMVRPFVFWAEDIGAMNPNPDEVAYIHHLPFSDFDRPDLIQLLPAGEDGKAVLRLLLGEHKIHAPTAAFLLQFHEVGVRGRHTRVDHYGQPDWAR